MCHFNIVFSLLAYFVTFGTGNVPDVKYRCQKNPLQDEINNTTNAFELKYDTKQLYASGVLKMELKMNKVQLGKYTVELKVINGTVNEIVSNSSEFYSYKTSYHSKFRNIYVTNGTAGTPLCQDGIVLCYRYIFTGWYMLLIENVHDFPPVFLNTTYQHSDLAIRALPKPKCEYSTQPINNSSKLQMWGEISVSVYEAPKKAIVKVLGGDGSNPCKTGTILDQVLKEEKDCEQRPNDKKLVWNFNASSGKDDKYCLRITFEDERCSVYRDSVWYGNACSWPIEDCKKVDPPPPPETSNTYLIGIIVAAIVFVGCGGVFIRWLVLRGSIQRVSEEEHSRSISIGQSIGEEDPILLLYARDSEPFMTFMTAFQDALKRCCGCDVYDWNGENNELGKFGVERWAMHKLSNGYRIVWIDTPRARSLIPSHLDDRNSAQAKQIPMGSFHDNVLRTILDMAKNSLRDGADQYTRHFVVCFEGFDAENEMYDPFANLSPHARYHIPQNFVELCSNVSERNRISLQAIHEEEEMLQEKLKKLNCINSDLEHEF